jgi:amino acid adenylation domain-containing protein
MALEAISHEEYPFPLLVERLRPNRETDRSPLFQVLFNFLKPQNFPEAIELWVGNERGTSIPWGGMSLGPFQLSQQEGQTDLTLEIAEGSTNLFGLFKYCVDLFDEPTIVRMAGHFETLLNGIIANPDCPLSELPLLGDRERHRLLYESNDTRKKFPDEKCVHQLFEEQAARTPDATAAVCEHASLSYSDLDERADELARRLMNAGAGPGSLIALCVDRSLEMLVGIIGILKSGAAYLPLDPDHPQSRIDTILQDSGVELLVANHDGIKLNIRRVAGQSRALIERPCSTVGAVYDRPTPTPDDTAYVIYTSGSTGRPKGVELKHRGVVNFLNSMAHEPGFTNQDKIVALTTISFDIAVLELLLPITVGGRVVIAKRQAATDPEALARLLRRSGATIVQATPATWRMLIDSGWEGQKDIKLLVGGESLSPELAEQLLKRCRTLWNMYGPTETTVWSATARITSTGCISIGRPIANTQFYVLHRGNQPAPVGIPGELYIGGEGVARGYWRRPDLTERSFVRDPFAEESGTRLYKTGDLVCYREDGRLQFLGRIDDQVKIRGYRIELGEIEAALRRHPSVREAAVVVHEDAQGDKRLAAYFESSSAAAVSPGDLRSQLTAMLPEYMVPSSFTCLERFPLTGSGKIDRKALPRPVPDQTSVTVPDVALTATQKSLVAIWSELLALQNVKLDDNLFHIGGHSLISVRLVSMIRQRLSVAIRVSDVFRYPTIRELGGYIDLQRRDSSSPSETPIDRTTQKGAFLKTKRSELPDSKIRIMLGLGSESFFRGVFNRILQSAAKAAPGVMRNVFHRWRGVRMGSNVLIGYDTVIETAYPWLISIGNNSSIGMRVTIIGHFLGMESRKRLLKGVTVQIGDDVWIGPGALVLPNVVIGDGAVVAAGSVVSGSVPPRTLVQGNPAVPVARCSVPIKPGTSFEEFAENLKPLD